MFCRTQYQKPKLSKTLQVGQLYKNLKSQNIDVTNLGMGQSPFPVPDLIQNSLKNNTHQADYLPITGLPELTTQIAAFYNRILPNCKILPENIIVTPGSKMAYYALQSILQNQLIVPQPSWVSYLDQSTLIFPSRTIHPPIKIHTTPKTEWKLTPTIISKQISPNKLKDACIILNNPNNPTGTTYTANELKELAQFFKLYNITVIADEVYWMLSHSEKFENTENTENTENNPSIANFLPDQTIFISSISKYFSAGGWRLGYIILPTKNPATSQVLSALKTFAANTWSCVAAPIQYALADAYKDLTSPKSQLAEELSKINRTLNFVSTKCYEILTQSPQTRKNIITTRSTGAYYFYLMFPNIPTSVCPATELLNKHRILTISGEAFGTTLNTIRVSYTNFDGSAALTHTDEEATNAKTFKETFQAFQTIVDWVNENSGHT